MLDAIDIQIGKIYKTKATRVLASLIRILGDLHLAEEALQDAFSIAMAKWPLEGIPQNPYAWLISTGKFKAIDMIRRQKRGEELLTEKFLLDDEPSQMQDNWEKLLIDDDQLRLIFYCCHPLLPLDSRIALSLREVCAMNHSEIARAYLVPTETIKKRISRAKNLIKEKNIPYEIPSRDQIQQRLDAVLQVIYLVFNEGYAATTGENHIRRELTAEAIFLGRKLVNLMPTSESLGLLALLLLHESRSQARVATNGDLIPLENQERSIWKQDLINEGLHLIQQAIMSAQLGPYTLQAAIASVHAQADSLANTRWDLIITYYDMLLAIQNSPVIELNRAIAVGMQQGPQVGLALIEVLLQNKKLQDYPSVYAAQADFCKKLGLTTKAIDAYQRAIELVQQGPETRYLQQQLAEIL